MRKETALISLTALLFFVIAGRCFADVSTLLKQAETYKKNGQYEQAEAIYKQIVTDYAFQAQKNLAILYVAWDKQPEADGALQQLLANFSQHKDIAQAVHDIAYQYRGVNKHHKANQIDQYVVENWPKTDYAVLAQMDLAKSYVNLGNAASAQAATDKLLANFSENPLIARAVHDIGQQYRWSRKYEKANKLYQYAIDNWPQTEHAMWAQADLIKSLLSLGNDSAAEAAVKKLLANFTDNPLIARAVWDTARVYRGLKKYEKANSLYQYVIDTWPDAEHAILSQMGMAQINILSLTESGNDTAAQAALDSLIDDFKGHPDLPLLLSEAADVYYNQALLYKKEGLDAKAKEHFKKALTVLEKIITQLPPSEPNTPEAYLFAGECYRQLGQHEKTVKYFEKVVSSWPDYKYAWSAQCLIGECYEKLRDSGALPESEANPKIEQAYKAVIEKYPDCCLVGHACLKLGWPSFKMGRWSEAATYFELFVQKSPHDPRWFRVLYDLGRAYEKMGKLDLAAEVYRLFIEMARPGDPRIRSVKLQLEELQGAKK